MRHYSARVTWGFITGLFGLLSSADAELVINEIHYHPPDKTEPSQFVEIYNTGATAVAVAGWSLAGDIQYTFPAGTTLATAEYAVVAQDPAFLLKKFKATAYGPFSGRLSARNGSVRLVDASGQTVNEVNYHQGFPWPTVGVLPGYSIELIEPHLDNSLGGSWRSSCTQPATPASSGILVPSRSEWKYLPGVQAPSSPASLWHDPGFEDASWRSGPAPIGYDPTESMGTPLNDMRGKYSSIYLRKTFTVDDIFEITGLNLDVFYDDGFNIWINGKHVLRQSAPSDDPAFGDLATATREAGTYDRFTVADLADLLVPGANVIAAQVLNVSLQSSSDCFFDLQMTAVKGSANTGNGPTPGRINSVYATNAPPQIRQVEHHPQAPSSGQPVRIVAKITDPDGVARVSLDYQVVDPGAYIEMTDPAYATNWVTVPMNDAGVDGDEIAGDDIYTATLPASLQVHRRLVRYRLAATDSAGQAVSVPYADDPQPNFAYYVYDGAPAWNGAIEPGSSNPERTQVTQFGTNLMSRTAVYQLIAKKNSVERATWLDRYDGAEYKWSGTLVYDGKVYDHIHYRARGGVWRYAMVKNMWKFDFNSGHDFEPRDDFGRKYHATWTKLNLGACIQQGDYGHRGEQGMFEAVGFKLFNLAGVQAAKTHWIQLRIVDEAEEASASDQYTGDFWGLYLAVEQMDGRFLDEHNLPDGNLYKMEGGTGALNNQGPTAVSDSSDLMQFMSAYSGNPTEAWWRTNFDLAGYYGFQAISQAIHNYDIGAGKNYFYYLNPVTGRWSFHPWDLDLTWADNMYDAGGQGADPFKNRVLPQPVFGVEYRNRVREIRDLLFNTDQAYQVIDEYAAMIHDATGAPSITDADRAMWDYNPKMADRSYSSSPSKAGKGLFYQFPNEPGLPKDFTATVRLMKDYVVKRGQLLDTSFGDPDIPATPAISAAGPAGFPVNRLVFNTSEFSGAGATFAAMAWRLAEITPPTQPAFDPSQPRHYEITADWESGELDRFSATLQIPSGVAKVGHLYRVRVRFKDTAARWSHWSAPVEFTAGEADNAASLADYLQITELMYHSPFGNEYDFVELHNSSTNEVLALGGVKFTQGIDYTFAAGVTLPPSGYLVLVKTEDFAAFRACYHLDDSVALAGPYGGNLDNNGETIALAAGAGGTNLIEFTYGNGRGWPVSADGAGHSLVPRASALSGESAGSLNYGDNWRASSYLNGSPGRGEAPLGASVVINEVASHTEYHDAQNPGDDSNDWIELYNAGETNVVLSGWYLSDDPAQLKKWAIPGAVLPAKGWIAFDEVTGFHSPLTAGFGLSSAGEQIYLSYLPGTVEDRVVDAVRIKGQELGISWGRYPDGGEYGFALAPTRAAANAKPAPPVVISEIMYHPLDTSVTNDNSNDEYIKLRNLSAASVPFADTNGAWRVDGSVKFTFPLNTVLPVSASLLVVNFHPTNTTALDAFRKTYGLTNLDLALYGPYEGKLPNSGGRVALDKPQAPEVGTVSWVIVDEVIYFDRPPWPPGADGTGSSLRRVSVEQSGNDPANWIVVAPFSEPVATTKPVLAIGGRSPFKLSIQAAVGVTVQVQISTNLVDWNTFKRAQVEASPIECEDPDTAGANARFYRVLQE